MLTVLCLIILFKLSVCSIIAAMLYCKSESVKSPLSLFLSGLVGVSGSDSGLSFSSGLRLQLAILQV